MRRPVRYELRIGEFFGIGLRFEAVGSPDIFEAARLKAVHALSFADCFGAATAIRERAPLVTGDPDFKKLGKAVVIDWVG